MEDICIVVLHFQTSMHFSGGMGIVIIFQAISKKLLFPYCKCLVMNNSRALRTLKTMEVEIIEEN